MIQEWAKSAGISIRSLCKMIKTDTKKNEVQMETEVLTSMLERKSFFFFLITKIDTMFKQTL